MTEVNLSETGVEALGEPPDAETRAAHEAEDEQAYQQALEDQDDYSEHYLEDDDDLEDEVNPYEIAVTNVDVSFLTNHQDGGAGLTLGDVMDAAALNLIRIGLDGYNLMLTDRDTGRQWVANQGRFIELAPLPEEQEPDAATD